VLSVSSLSRKTARSIVLVVSLLVAKNVFSTDLKITDSTNTVIIVHDAFIDYGGLMGDKEPDGIRIYQGEAMLTAKWGNIRSITITGREAAPGGRLKAEVVPRSGNKISTALVTKGRMKLSGKTDLGEYAIDLEKVRLIEPIDQK
jgi:hypothetical protein